MHHYHKLHSAQCLRATEIKVKVQYPALAQIYHPNKNIPTRTEMTQKSAIKYSSKLTKNALLCDALYHPDLCVCLTKDPLQEIT